MKFIRHVLSHLLLITLLVGVCAVYFFRYELLPEMYTQKVDHYAGAIHPKLVTIASKKISQPEAKQEKVTQADQEIDVIYVDDVPLVDESKVQQTAGNEEEVITTVKAQPEEEQVQQQEVQELAEEKPEKKEAAENDTAEVAAVQKEEKPVEEVAEETSVSEDKAAAGYSVVLRDARTAFGQGKMDLAIKKYNELIDLEDEADFHGELGNVYYATGKWDLAGASYYEAAVRLIDDGQLSQVGYLQRVIQGLDAGRAEKLAKKLATQR